MLRRAEPSLTLVPQLLDDRGLPELVGGGYNEWTRRRPHALGEHDHGGHWELHYLVHGQIIETIAGTTHLMNAGDVLIASPGLRHSGINRVRHRCGLCWLGLRFTPGRALPGLTRAQTGMIHDGFRRAADVPFAGDPWLLPAFTGLLREGARPDDDARVLACRSYLHAILTLTARRPAVAVAPAPRSAAIARAAVLLGQRLDQPLRIASLSAAVGLGRTVLHERFLAELGVTPAEHRMTLRLDEAKRLLPVASNAEVAHRLGFASAQHFITAFRRAFAATPGAWRARTRGAEAD